MVKIICGELEEVLYTRPQSDTKWFMKEPYAGRGEYKMLAERYRSFKDEDGGEVPGRRHDGYGLSAQTLDTTFDICTTKLLDVRLLGFIRCRSEDYLVESHVARRISLQASELPLVRDIVCEDYWTLLGAYSLGNQSLTFRKAWLANPWLKLLNSALKPEK